VHPKFPKLVPGWCRAPEKPASWVGEVEHRMGAEKPNFATLVSCCEHDRCELSLRREIFLDV
jgi:hypothetical protein